MEKINRFIFLALALCFAAGCGDSGDVRERQNYYIYYLNKNITKIEEAPCDLESKSGDTKGMIDEFIGKMQEDSGDLEYKKVIPDDVKVDSYILEGTLLTLYFSKEYRMMDPVQETLSRAAIVRTLTQVEGVECLSFYINEEPLKDGKGNLVGVMTNDSFIENPGEQINSIQTSTIVLYFSNLEGNGLVQETQEVHYSSNISLEKLVIEHLLEGPKSKNAQAAIPEGTKLVGVSVLDGVCYVNLDDAFLNQNYSIEEPVVIYSIVDSLSELSTINKVQISVNGNTKGVYRDSFALDDLYERNLDYVEEVITSEVEVNDVEGRGESDTSE
ncbi:MAG: GerMN domain-containing protein [Roseburia sp.]|nr:GerMN domain-containing protein [Roseburia sp.]